MLTLQLSRRFETFLFKNTYLFLLLGLLLIAAIGGAWGFHTNVSSGATGVSLPQPRTVTVSTTSVVSNLNEVGVIEPGSHVAVVSPFDGFIKETFSEIGSHVDVGEPLLEIDTGEIDIRLRDAEGALLKATRAFEDVDKWSTGSEVLRAKRSLANAVAQLDNLNQQQRQAKTLIDRGIISKNEYDGIVQQVRAQRDQVASAQQDLDSTVNRGNSSNRRLAELDLASARARVDELTAQRALNIVHASKAGILMRPPASSDRADGIVATEAGGHITRGQALFIIANHDALVVEARVDEVDVDQIHVGQEVMIESDSFPGIPLQGKIIYVDGQADQAASMSGSAHFLVKAQLTVDPQSQSSVRIGMSARLTITTYKKPDAIVIPAEAVTTENGRRSVSVIDAQTGETHHVAVTLGAPTPSGIEILSGLVDGQVITLP